MTNKLTVPSELIHRAIDAIEQVGYQDKFIDYTFVRAVKQELLAALADPVPPAGVEVEVLAWVNFEDGRRGVDWYPGVLAGALVGTELVDRAHVTRLQAEVRQLRQHKNDYMEAAEETRKALQAEVDKAIRNIHEWRSSFYKQQSELTKARELLKEADNFMYIMTGHDSHARLVHQYGKEWWTPVNELRGKICTALSNQSAPADKGQDDCAHSEANKHGCPECGEEFKP